MRHYVSGSAASIGVPVRSEPDGPVVAAISAAGPTTRVVGSHETHHAHLLLNAAEQLARSLRSGHFTLPRSARS